MALSKAKGNMFEFVSHTWNPLKGRCPHQCGYCYVDRIYKRFKRNIPPLHLDERELKTDLGSGNFIFVGSSTDMWAKDVPDEWINKIMDKITKGFEQGKANKYLFQSKNPARFADYQICFASNQQDYVLATTIETNRYYPQMGNAVAPVKRCLDFAIPRFANLSKMITVEPIMDFDLSLFIEILKTPKPVQVNIGADSGNNHLTEPPKDKILALIGLLQTAGIKVFQKKNLKRLLA